MDHLILSVSESIKGKPISATNTMWTIAWLLTSVHIGNLLRIAYCRNNADVNALDQCV